MAKKNKGKRTVRTSAINNKGFAVRKDIKTKTYTEDNLLFDLANTEVKVISYLDY